MPIRLTRAVRILLIISFTVFLVQQTVDLFLGGHLLSWISLVPATFWGKHAYWQLFTYPFAHREVIQLFFNLMMVAFIGSELEAIWGSGRFLRYYFFCSISSALFYLFVQAFVLKGTGAYRPLIGASGAIYGLLAAYGLIFGERVLLFMMLFPMKAKHFVWVLGLLELLTTFYSAGGAASSFALLGGMVAGFAYLWMRATWNLRASRRFPEKELRRGRSSGKSSKWGFFSRQSKKRASKHLKLIVNNEHDPDHDEPNNDGSEKNSPRTWH